MIVGTEKTPNLTTEIQKVARDKGKEEERTERVTRIVAMTQAFFFQLFNKISAQLCFLLHFSRKAPQRQKTGGRFTIQYN